MTEEDGFLQRWSKRKRASQAPVVAEAPPEAAPEKASAEEPQEAFDIESLPDIETLGADSDIKAFLHKAVPEDLRNAALRKIWSADPAIRDYIGPVDYGWDFNNPAGIPGFSDAKPTFDVAASVERILGKASPSEDKDSPNHLPGEPVSKWSTSDGATRESALVADKAESAAENDPRADQPVEQQSIENTENIAFRRHGGALPD